MSLGALRFRARRPVVDGAAVAVWAAGLVVVVLGAMLLVKLNPSMLTVVALVASVVVLALVAMAPPAVVPIAWVLVVFIGVIRKIVAGPSGHIENDPLIAAPFALLVPLLLARLWWRARYRAHLWLALAYAALVLGAFLVVLAQGDTTFTTLRAFGEQFIAPLIAVALAHPSMRGSVRATFVVVRISTVLAGLYGILQFVAPPRWDMRWLQNVVAQGIQSFGIAEPGHFRLFGPLNSPLAFAMILSVGIVCWIFSTTPVWMRILAIAIMVLPLVLTLVRTSLFALAVVLPIVALVHYRRRAIVPLVAMAAGLGGFWWLLVTLVPDQVQRYSVDSLSTDTSYNSRLRLLDNGTSSLFGFGGGPGASSRGSIVTDNGYLAAFIDFGTLGGLLLIAILLTAIVAAFRYALNPANPARGLPLGLVLLYALSETSAPVIQGQVGLLFWVVLGMLGADVVARRHAVPGTVPLGDPDEQRPFGRHIAPAPAAHVPAYQRHPATDRLAAAAPTRGEQR